MYTIAMGPQHIRLLVIPLCILYYEKHIVISIDVYRQYSHGRLNGLRSRPTTVLLPTAARCRTSCEYCLLYKVYGGIKHFLIEK